MAHEDSVFLGEDDASHHPHLSALRLYGSAPSLAQAAGAETL
ncbi:hypothetical protein [Zoogloea dura]|nr:hypothetical protein [Zoogloea dura]